MGNLKLKEGIDSANRMKLLMNYSLSKTLDENRTDLHEQMKTDIGGNYKGMFDALPRRNPNAEITNIMRNIETLLNNCSIKGSNFTQENATNSAERLFNSLSEAAMGTIGYMGTNKQRYINNMGFLNRVNFPGACMVVKTLEEQVHLGRQQISFIQYVWQQAGTRFPWEYFYKGLQESRKRDIVDTTWNAFPCVSYLKTVVGKDGIKYKHNPKRDEWYGIMNGTLYKLNNKTSLYEPFEC